VQATEQNSPFCLPPAIVNMVPQFWHLCCFAENKTTRHGSQYFTGLEDAIKSALQLQHLFFVPFL
jgi:hypothetical protein